MPQILLVFLLLPIHLALRNEEVFFVKPDFEPYCSSINTCWSDCECLATDNCNLLLITDNTKEDIVSTLNQKRDKQSKGTPAPSGLAMLSYDSQLEQLSKCWASRCENMYSECLRTLKFNETSQSVGQITFGDDVSPSSGQWVSIIDYWFGEKASLNYEITNSVPKGELGDRIHNFAQILSDRVLSVGCAWSLIGYTITFVCTFGPRGPYEGEDIYKTGEVCTGCPKGYACDLQMPFENLCKRKEVFPRSNDNETDMMKIGIEETTSETNGTAASTEAENEVESEEDSSTWRVPRAGEDSDTNDLNIIWIFGVGLGFFALVVVVVVALYYILGIADLEDY